MTHEDFLKYFDSVTICYYHDSHVLSSVPGISSDQGRSCYQFDIDTEGEYYFGLSQSDKKLFEGDHEYGILSLMLVRMDGDKPTYIGGQHYPRRDVWFKTKCKRGKYVVIARTNWAKKKSTFWSYGTQAVEIQQLEKTENLDKCSVLIEKIFLGYVSFKNLLLGS